MSNPNPYVLRETYTRFRILVIGRANAGKTTLLQRVCNTTEDPCIYDEDNNNLVSAHRSEDEFYFWHILLAWTHLSGTPLTLDICYCSWPYHTARDTWHPSAVCIQEQPRIYLSRFSRIWDRRQKATAGCPVVYGGESKVDWCRRSAACYLVCFDISAYLLATDDQFCGERFCFVLNNARPLLPLETAFFESARAGKGFYYPVFQVNPRLTFYSTRNCDLYQVRWSDDSDLWHQSKWRCQSSKCGGTTGKEV